MNQFVCLYKHELQRNNPNAFQNIYDVASMTGNELDLQLLKQAREELEDGITRVS
ncbi:hypothetical protein [Paraliobacillus ryukyuensis]|uniref:hypothetical protein n=1 Tax=Paraliobacillus ryukyuensis TaxID=200904 RepID=UPI0015C46C66|nr:hypothetical protein [Paraliobacillus ryukyuensis]